MLHLAQHAGVLLRVYVVSDTVRPEYFQHPHWHGDDESDGSREQVYFLQYFLQGVYRTLLCPVRTTPHCIPKSTPRTSGHNSSDLWFFFDLSISNNRYNAGLSFGSKSLEAKLHPAELNVSKNRY